MTAKVFRALYGDKRQTLIFALFSAVWAVLLLVFKKSYMSLPSAVFSVSMMIYGVLLFAVVIQAAIDKKSPVFIKDAIYCALYIIPSGMMLFDSYLIKFSIVVVLLLCAVIKMRDGIEMLINKSPLSAVSLVFGLASISVAVYLVMMKPRDIEEVFGLFSAVLIAGAVSDIISAVCYCVSVFNFLRKMHFKGR